tara:strand:+ start:2180 stop:2626 length:447 start_codon:yes stop_codon:yes gene_type:complete
MNVANLESSKIKSEKIKIDLKDSKYATGRRKRSIARVWVKKGSGKIYVNGKEMNKYFKRPVHQMLVVRPLQEINAPNEYDVKCSVKGGGLSGQAGAIIHGLSRALVSIDSSLKKTLKKNKLTTRDSRKVERKKYGHKKARRSFQFSKR